MLLKMRLIPGIALLIAGSAFLILVSPARRRLGGDLSQPYLQGERDQLRDRSSRNCTSADPALRRSLATLNATDEEDRGPILETITAAWPVDELGKTVIALFSGESTEPSAALLRAELLRRWVAVDPAAIAAWVSTKDSGSVPLDAVEQVALAWSSSDSDAAWNWVFGLPAGAQRSAALLSLAYELCRDNPAQALARWHDLEEGPARDQFVEHAIGNLAIVNPATALEYAQGLADPLVRNNAFAVLSSSWAESDPVAAATFVAGEMEPGAPQDRAVAAIVQRWSQQDPAAVRAWIEDFPVGSLKENALALLDVAVAQATESIKTR